MNHTILLMADLLITALILFVVFEVRSKRPRAELRARKAEEEALLAMRKVIDDLGGREKDLDKKQKMLKGIIERLDGALADIHGAPVEEGGKEADYKTARDLLKRGEPVEKVIEMFNITRGEADVLTSINAMAS